MDILNTKIKNILAEKATKIKPENIKKDMTIFNITGTLEEGVDTSDADATTNDIAKNKTAYVNGEKITGTLSEVTSGSAGAYAKDESFTMTDKPTYNILEGKLPFRTDVLHRANSSTVFNMTYSSIAHAINLNANQIKKGEKVLGVTGTYESEYNVKINSIFARTSTIQNSITEIQEVDFSNLTNADSKLASMPNLVTISLKNTNKITNFTNLFKNDTALKNINLFDTGNATNMAGMFSGCSSIENIPLFNTSKAQTLATMFLNCTSLKTVPAFDGSSLTNVTQLFEGCTALTSVPLFDTSHVVVSNCQSMFKNCTSLQTVPQFNFSGITTSMYAMFTNCPSLSDESLNNIMAMCAATGITNTSYMSLAVIGLSSTQATRCTTLSNWASFSAAGWTTGY